MSIPESVLSSLTVAFWSSFLVAALLSWPIYRLLLLTKSRQTVSQHAPSTHLQKQGTPTMGGIILVFGFLAAAFELSITSNDTIQWPTVVLFVGFALIGFVDDFVVPKLIRGKRGLGWKQKFLMQAVIAGACIYYHSGSTLDMRWGVITFVVLFMANAYNFSDGLDALAGSLLVIFGVGVIVLSMSGMIVPEPAICAVALIGAVIPFLFFNAPPAKVFMGDVGSLPVGAVLGLAVATIASPRAVALPPQDYVTFYDQWLSQLAVEGTRLRVDMLIPLSILCLIMVIELVPVPMQIFWVKVFKRKLFPFTPIHHAFEKAGWPESRVVWTFALSQLVFVALAIFAYKGVPSTFGPERRAAATRALQQEAANPKLDVKPINMPGANK